MTTATSDWPREVDSLKADHRRTRDRLAALEAAVAQLRAIVYGDGGSPGQLRASGDREAQS